MKHRHKDRSQERLTPNEDHAGRQHESHRRRHDGGRHGTRPFDYGELRLLALAMIAEQPCHGYELMKAVEERMGGSYRPSPGVVYPTLSWLDDMGYAVVEVQDAGRRRYSITAEGQAFLAANRLAVEALFSRIGAAGSRGTDHVPAPLLRGMENLKFALQLRLRKGAIDQSAAENIAAALDAAARAVERS